MGFGKWNSVLRDIFGAQSDDVTREVEKTA
jgi:hypothetical protein